MFCGVANSYYFLLFISNKNIFVKNTPLGLTLFEKYFDMITDGEWRMVGCR